MVRAMSAAVDQLRRRQISNSARQMRGAFWLTYIMSAVSEKLSARARPTYACHDITEHVASRSCASQPLLQSWLVCRVQVHGSLRVH